MGGLGSMALWLRIPLTATAEEADPCSSTPQLASAPQPDGVPAPAESAAAAGNSTEDAPASGRAGDTWEWWNQVRPPKP